MSFSDYLNSSKVHFPHGLRKGMKVELVGIKRILKVNLVSNKGDYRRNPQKVRKNLLVESHVIFNEILYVYFGISYFY